MTDVEHDLFAFVLMPFSAEFDDIYRLGIKEPAITLGITAERVDEQLYREPKLERIYRQIELADIVIADMTGRNRTSFMRSAMHTLRASFASFSRPKRMTFRLT